MKKISFLSIFILLISNEIAAQGPAKFVGPFAIREVVADVETSPVISNEDAADDICIYENIDNPEKSLIIATDKKYGLVIYNLDGKILYDYPFGRVNNVDIINNFNFGGESFPLICGSNRSTNTIELYKLNVNDLSLELILKENNKSSLEDVYGITFYNSNNGEYIFVSDKETGEVEQWIVKKNNDSISIEKIRTLKFKTLIEGLVADEYYGKIYIAEENKGLWQVNAEPNLNENRKLVFEVNKTFKKDFEGLALYQSDMENGVIVISVQGSNGYALLDRKTQTLIRFIKVVDGNGIDGTSDTDGLEVSTISTNRFKKGFLVVQDGFNDNGFQNFKIIDWDKVD